jgi:DUF4097 and DUF4098 domain-containing protein YvlB
VLAAGAALAQESIDRLKVAFRDPSRPGTIKMNLLRGSVTVKGYNGQEVLVEAGPRRRGGGDDDEEDDKRKETAGLRRIITPNTSLAVEEENNVMKIEVQASRRAMDVTLQVPFKTSLNLHAINNGNITVENVHGDIEVNNLNGQVLLTNVGGSIVAHALNGRITATVRDVDASKPMSFSSLNGNIDVTLPPTIKANFNLQTARGEVYSDFDVVLGATPPKVEESKREEGRGRYRVSTGHGVIGKVNGGGQDMTFKNMNGNIYIRKGK